MFMNGSESELVEYSNNRERRNLGIKRIAQGIGSYALGLVIGIAGEKLNTPILKDLADVVLVGSTLRGIEGVITLPITKPIVESFLHGARPVISTSYEDLQLNIDKYLP